MPEPAKSFTCFPRLPAEIQDEIWFYACRLAQVVPMRTSYANMGITIHPGSQVPPGLLHSCHRARELAQKVYKHHRLTSGKLLFFNQLSDIIYLRGSLKDMNGNPITPRDNAIALRRLLQHNFQLRYLAVPLREYRSSRTELDIFAIRSLVREFPNLQELMLVVYIPRENWKMSITGFSPAEKFDFCWRDDIGKLQLELFADELADLRVDQAEDANAQNNSVPGPSLGSLPKVTFKLMQRERDWRATNAAVQTILRKQRDAAFRPANRRGNP